MWTLVSVQSIEAIRNYGRLPRLQNGKGRQTVKRITKGARAHLLAITSRKRRRPSWDRFVLSAMRLYDYRSWDKTPKI